jgi:uncharacterized repeat protein (TIGR03803 family)
VVLHNFAQFAAKGSNPATGVIRDADGNLYGTAPGGTAGQGVVYKVDPAGNEMLLYAFSGGAAGGTPTSPGSQWRALWNGHQRRNYVRRRSIHGRTVAQALMPAALALLPAQANAVRHIGGSIP